MRHLIEQATEILESKIQKKPVEYSPNLSKPLGHPIYLKLDCLLVTSSFKVRDGFFFLSTLNTIERKRGSDYLNRTQRQLSHDSTDIR